MNKLCVYTIFKNEDEHIYDWLNSIKDADLIGFPFRITVGKTIVDGNVDFVTRETGEKVPMKPEEAAQKVIEAVNSLEK